MSKFRIYSIEDDEDIAYIINATLSKQGYEVTTFYDGETFLDQFSKNPPDMILLDMMLPKIQGKAILKFIRGDHRYDSIQIIIISANNLTIDKIDGLDLGADDYIAKPFDLMELVSRVNARARRIVSPNNIVIGDFELNLANKTLSKSSEFINLTQSEFKVLSLLFENRHRVVSKDDIAQELYGDTSKANSRTISMIIKSLREKLGDVGQTFIVSRYGFGYIINE
jgi:two-component system alkaline phosphatase synthesis response regulator PhoP